MTQRKQHQLLGQGEPDGVFLRHALIVRYGELVLKGKNRSDFVKCLLYNAKRALDGIQCRIRTAHDHLEIADFAPDDMKRIVAALRHVPGISVINVGYKMARSVRLLCECANANVKGARTFKLECVRRDKTYPLNSRELVKKVAGNVLARNPDLKVNLTEPDELIRIEVEKDCFLLFARRIQGANGLPVGSSGRVLVLLSGGIDSPVAAHLLMCRGLHVDFLTFVTPPHTAEAALDKTKRLAQIVTRNGTLCDSKLYVSNFAAVVRELSHVDPEAYRITMLRRCFLKQAGLLMREHRYDAIATGDSLGQVASQTIRSLSAVSDASPGLILRPLVGLDKLRIIALAKQIGTYETSILPYEDACGLFAPKNPVTMPKKHVVDKIEQQFAYIDILISKLTKNNVTALSVRELPR